MDEHLRCFPLVSPGQALIRRSVFVELGGFDTTLWGADDWDLWFRLVARWPAEHVGRPVLRYRVHARNASRHASRHCRNMLKVVDRQLAILPSDDRILLRALSLPTLLPWWRKQITRSMRTARAEGDVRRLLMDGCMWAEVSLRAAISRLRLKPWLLRRGQWTIDPRDPRVRAFRGEPEPGPVDAHAFVRDADRASTPETPQHHSSRVRR